MSATGRTGTKRPTADEVATRLQDAGFVRLVAARSGDGVAAAGLLAGALDVRDCPYQVSVVGVPEPADRSTDADLTIALGRPDGSVDLALGTADAAASPIAQEVATALGGGDLALAMAGVCGTDHAGERLLTAASDRGIEPGPGVGLPVSDLADGLAHSTLVHAPFSGDPEAAADIVAGLDVDGSDDDECGRTVASLVAFAVGGDPDSTPRAARQVERLLAPHAFGPFETVPGYAEVLDATARERPGLAVPVALGRVDDSTALDVWRTHARRAHEAVRSASTGRYDGLFVARPSGTVPAGTVARLVRDYRSPEPLVLVVADGDAVATGTDNYRGADVGSTMATAAASAGGRGGGSRTWGRATFETDPSKFVVEFREEL